MIEYIKKKTPTFRNDFFNCCKKNSRDNIFGPGLKSVPYIELSLPKIILKVGKTYKPSFEGTEHKYHWAARTLEKGKHSYTPYSLQNFPQGISKLW